jgi:hypothetical protein
MSRRLPFKVAGVYDTETTTLQDGARSVAFPCLYICNDIRDIDIAVYEAEISDDIRYYRYAGDVLEWLGDLMQWGYSAGVVPVVCAYNLMFDLQPIMHDLARQYDIKVNAQSATHVYTLDLCFEGGVCLRFWDTYYFEMSGLAAMGRTCGLAKALGDWDYNLTRTPETPLTADEMHYAARDVQVIPAYLRYLIEANEWLEPDMLASTVLTKTSLVRQMAQRTIGRERISFSNGQRHSLFDAFKMTCIREWAPNFYLYALRKACFRGGLTFTSANLAHTVQTNVASLDVTSMHHLFIAGRYLPRRFRVPASVEPLQRVAERILATSRAEVLRNYQCPFPFALHARIRFDNLRLKPGTVFEREGIAIIPQGKFTSKVGEVDFMTASGAIAEEAARQSGWVDSATGARFAFSKLLSAETATLHLTEIELWSLSRVYVWDDMRVICGEYSQNYVKAPDYLVLQTHVLYATKNAMKEIVNHYTEGVPYERPIGATVPEAIADDVRTGVASAAFLKAYYGSTVKGMFNGIYGTQAQDIMKPSYRCLADGTLEVDRATVASLETYDDLKPKTVKVLYNFGSRIVGGSRMHLVIALELLYEALGDRARVCGGDTDSIKLACDGDVANTDIIEALAPLHTAARLAIERGSERVRRNFPHFSSELSGVGEFVIEDCGGADRYPLHWEAWNKSRLDRDGSGAYHITCAGLSRPADCYNAEDWARDMEARGMGFEEVASSLLGYNSVIDYNLCYHLERTHPHPADRVQRDVTDWRGETAHVDAPASIALYPSARVIGDTSKISNAQNLQYLREIGRDIDDSVKFMGHNERGAYIDRE